MITTPVDPLLSLKEAAPLLNMSPSTFLRRVADGTFPKPVKLGHLSRWPRSELLDAIERLKTRRTEQRAEQPR